MRELNKVVSYQGIYSVARTNFTSNSCLVFHTDASTVVATTGTAMHTTAGTRSVSFENEDFYIKFVFIRFP